MGSVKVEAITLAVNYNFIITKTRQPALNGSLVELPCYDMIFSRMLAYSQDFARMVKGEDKKGEYRIRLRQHEGVRE
ncbi:hypothetical protein [Bacillus sp. FJAT-26390]|uniref:hypothetical protein n=1 Tax=Bacillus sp. FJAT-26390 TaxID=1743142 RepID=UPI000807BC4D|nr:hypothetical protein [Bacillus sp. FJAT-26390]OBZ15811.1 hypothetical protein A7975_30685 [Bacillus sp. FJAT-26390]